MPSVYLQVLSSKVSYHCPLLIAGQATVRRYSGFRFEAFWPKLPRYIAQAAATTSWYLGFVRQDLSHRLDWFLTCL